MSALGRARAWVRAVALRGRMEREMREEMAAHIAQAAERFMARGMSRKAALLEARREFGHVGAMEQSGRDARPGQWIDSLAGDLKYSFRYYARTPLTSITIVLTLALGIGFSSAGFSVIGGILTRPAAGVPADPRLVKIRGLSDASPFARRLSYPELAAYAGLTDKFASVIGWGSDAVVFDAGRSDFGAISAQGAYVTPNYFTTLGISLAAGRTFGQSRFDPAAPPELTAILSYALASEQFGGAANAVGRQVKVNNVVMTIVGVAPPRFAGPVQSGETRIVWLPLSTLHAVGRAQTRLLANADAQWLEAAARLRAGVALTEALAAVRVVAARTDADAKARATRRQTITADVVPLRGMIDVTGRYDAELLPGIVWFSAIAILVLLVCTTTVNSLLVGTAVARRYEIGVRLALGASRRRVVRQLVTEIVILSLAGGALGMWVFGILSRLTEVARDGFDVSPNWQTMSFVLLYSMLTATLCGLSPALHATRTGLSDVLKDSPAGTTTRSRLQRTFVIAQIAIAQPLMVALTAVMVNLVSKVPAAGIAPLRERLVIAELDTYVNWSVGGPDRVPDLVARIAEVPGVAAVLPVGFGRGRVTLEQSPPPIAVGDPIPAIYAELWDVPAGYFDVVDAPIVRGRGFVASDTMLAVTPVVVSESLAVELFKSGDPVGRRIRRPSRDNEAPIEMEVVGVVRMTQDNNAQSFPSDDPPMFVPYRRGREGRLLIRTSGPAEPLIPTMMAIARQEVRMVPVRRLVTLAQNDHRRRNDRLQVTGTVAGIGTLALILASVGLYAMLRIGVERRRREIGVRMALGARGRDVVLMFFTSGMRVALTGLALGLPLSLAGLAYLTLRTDMQEHSVAVIASAVTVAVVGVAALASWLPARRAAAVDPMVALRSE